MRIIKRAKEISNEVLEMRLGSKEQTIEAAVEIVKKEYEVGSLAYIIIIKIIMAIIEHILLSGEMPSDSDLEDIAQKSS